MEDGFGNAPRVEKMPHSSSAVLGGVNEYDVRSRTGECDARMDEYDARSRTATEKEVDEEVGRSPCLSFCAFIRRASRRGSFCSVCLSFSEFLTICFAQVGALCST